MPEISHQILGKKISSSRAKIIQSFSREGLSSRVDFSQCKLTLNSLLVNFPEVTSRMSKLRVNTGRLSERNGRRIAAPSVLAQEKHSSSLLPTAESSFDPIAVLSLSLSLVVHLLVQAHQLARSQLTGL